MSPSSVTRPLVRMVTVVVRRLAVGRVPKLFDAAYYLSHNDAVAASGVQSNTAAPKPPTGA